MKKMNKILIFLLLPTLLVINIYILWNNSNHLKIVRVSSPLMAGELITQDTLEKKLSYERISTKELKSMQGTVFTSKEDLKKYIDKGYMLKNTTSGPMIKENIIVK